MKKAQVSLFIILGLIIIIAALFFFTYRFSQREIITEEGEEIRGPAKDAKLIVDSCLGRVVLEGLEIMRLQAGQIDIPLDAPVLKVMDEKESVVVSEGRYKLSGSGVNNVPFWLTKDYVRMPTIDFLEKELEDYATKEVQICIDDFSELKKRNMEVEYGEMMISVDMGKDVLVNVSFPITIKKGNDIYDISRFIYRVPINMKLIHNMAYTLTSSEVLSAYLEKHVMDLINLYSGLDDDKLPPAARTSVNFDCNSVKWNDNDVENNLKNIFNENFQYLKINQTDFERVEREDEIEQGVYDGFIYDFGFYEDYPNLRVDFDYDNWDFGIYDVKPYSGKGISPPDRVSQTNVPFLPLFCTFKYRYKYDLAFPVLVTVRDKDSAEIDPVSKTYEEGMGFEMQFPIEVFVCGNQKRICTGKPAYQELGFEANKSLLGFSGNSYFCDMKQRISGEHTINVFDYETRERVEDADIYYYCGSDLNNCYIGRSDHEGKLISKFPLCHNGLVNIQHLNYSNLREVLSVEGDDTNEVNYYIEPNKKFDMSLKVVDVKDFVKKYYEGNLDYLQYHELNENEEGWISASGQRNIYAVYPPNATIVMGGEKIVVNSGDYILNIILKGEVVIKPSVYKEDDKEIVVSFSPTGSGNYKGQWQIGSLDNLEWSVDRDELIDKKEVEFYVFAEQRAGDDLEVRDFGDSFIAEDGSLRAEILLRGQNVGTIGNPVCVNHEFVSISGRQSDDFKERGCDRVVYVDISEEEYKQYLRPVFR